MSAIRYTSIFPSERGKTVTIELWDTAYAGASADFRVAGDGYTLDYSANGFDAPAQFMSTQCSFVFIIEDETQFDLIDDFATSQEGRFLVKIYESEPFVANHLVWTGLVLLDISAYQEKGFPFDFMIKATDGVGTLKDIDFNDTSGMTPVAYTGKNKLIEYLCRALSRITYVSEFYGSGNTFLQTSVDWWEETQTNSSTGVDTLDQTYIDNAVYYKYEKAMQGFQSCYDVIKDILTEFEGRITYSEGAFWIEQLSYRQTNTIIQRNYDVDGVFIDATNYGSPNNITQVAAGALLAIADYEFAAPLSEVRHTFNANERRNFFVGAENVDESHTGIDTFYVPIHANNGETTLRMTGNLNVRIKSLISDPSFLTPLKPFVGVMRINLFLNTVGLQRLYTLQTSYQVTFEPPIWNATPGCYIIQPFTGGGFLSNTTADFYTFFQAIDIMSPVMPENTETFTFSISFDALERYDGGTYSLSDFEIEYDLTDLWLEAYSYGSPQLSDDVHIYKTFNTETNNSLVYKSESLIGSSTNPNTIGALWVKPGADYQLAGAWGEGVAAPTYDYLGQLLTTTVASTHAKPARKLNGALYGDIKSLSRVVWQSLNWILIGGSWNAQNSILSGEWIEMKNTGGLTPSPPIKTKIVSTTGTQGPPVGPGKGYGIHTTTPSTGSDGWFGMSSPIGTLLIPVASALTLEDIQPGTITSIATIQTLEDYSFNTGDKLIIGNPFTGSFEELTVSALSNSGDTAIAVSGTLKGSYPEGSPLVRLEYIGAGYSLPGGVNGQIFRRTGGKWAGYGDGTLTDGHFLKWTAALGFHTAAVSAGLSDGDYGDIVVSSSGTVMTVDGHVVTFAKMQQLPTLTIMGNNTGSTADVLALTVAQVKTMLSLSGTNSGDQTIALTGDVTGSGTGTFAATIANNAVTLAKMAQVVTQTFLGRTTASTGTVEALTVTQATAMLNVFTSSLKGLVPLSGGGTANYLRADGTWAAPTGAGVTQATTLVSGRVTLSAGSNSITDNALLRFDGTRLAIGAGTQTGFLDVFAGALSGTNLFYNASANVNGNMIGQLINASTLAAGNAFWVLSVGGTAAGDPFIQFVVSGGAGTFAVGVDNSDGDKFKITPNSSTPGGVVNSGISVSNTATAFVGINKDAAAHPLDVGGKTRSQLFINDVGFSATAAIGTGAGSGSTSVVSSSGNWVLLQVTVAGTPVANGVVATVTMPIAFPVLAYPLGSPFDATTATNFSKFFFSTLNTTQFQIKANGTAPLGTFQFMLNVVG